MRQFSLLQKYVLLSAAFVVIFLWHLLAPGYVLLLDWIAGPVPLFSYSSVDEMANVPVNALLYVLGSVLPGWLVQKVTLVAVGFFLLFVPLRLSLFKDLTPRLFVAFLIAINPFVYERLLAGQWRVVVGYLFVYALIVFLLRSSVRYKHIFGTLVLCGMFSLHFLVIGCLITGVWFVGKVLFVPDLAGSRRDFILRFARAFAVFAVISLYWIVPFFLSGMTDNARGSSLGFSSAHWEAFASVGEQRWGPIVNTALFHGFWLEDRAWSEDFSIVSQTAVFLWGIGVLYVLAFVGLFVRLRYRGSRTMMTKSMSHFRAGFLVVCYLIAFCFSLGVSATSLYGINIWLFEHVPMWSGFRDSQKWSGVLVIAVAIFAGYGFDRFLYLMHRLPELLQSAMHVIILSVPLVITPYMLFGLASQVQVSDYPVSWYEARDVLLSVEREESCHVVFLPWHQYYRLSHNGQALSANVSRRFFPCQVISGQNTAVDNVGTDYSRTYESYELVDSLVTSNDDQVSSVDVVIDGLQRGGVTHVVFTSDLVGRDVYNYPFLASDNLKVIYEGEGISVFAL